MSQYATMQGSIQYPDQKSFDEIVDTLMKGGWMNQEGFFVTDSDEVVEQGGLCREHLGIDIPTANFRNLSRVDFFPPGAKGYLVITSTDGCFNGWVINDGVEVEYDLEKWALENMEGDDRYPPTKWQCNFDEDEFNENMNIWTQEVEMAFFETFS